MYQIAVPVTGSANQTGSFIKRKKKKKTLYKRKDNKDKGHSDHRRQNRKVAVTLFSVQASRKSVPQKETVPNFPSYSSRLLLTLTVVCVFFFHLK